MADETTTETVKTEQPIKSATDLELEKLSARLDALETENKELRSANKGLWAQLHPVQEQPVVTTAPTTESDADVSYKVLVDKLGLKKEEGK